MSFLANISKLKARASSSAAKLIGLAETNVFPILTGAGFEPSPEYSARTANKYGQIWGLNDVAFQDRRHQGWPTIVVNFNRDLEPSFKVELCEIPEKPIMLDNTALTRSEANSAHAITLLFLSKGLTKSYRDHEFGAPIFSLFKEKRISRDIALCVDLLMKVVALPRERFVETVEASIAPKNLYCAWRKDDKHRPNLSA